MKGLIVYIIHIYIYIYTVFTHCHSLHKQRSNNNSDQWSVFPLPWSSSMHSSLHTERLLCCVQPTSGQCFVNSSLNGSTGPVLSCRLQTEGRLYQRHVVTEGNLEGSRHYHPNDFGWLNAAWQTVNLHMWKDPTKTPNERLYPMMILDIILSFNST